MASIEQLKQQIDLHDLASRLGLERPQGTGNYRSPAHEDKTPSLSVYVAQSGDQRWKDHSTGEGGSCIDLVQYVEGCDTAEAIRRLRALYGIEEDPAPQAGQREKKSKAEWIAGKCLEEAGPAIEYLVGRGISEAVAQEAVKARTIGWNSYTSEKIPAGQHGHGGPALAQIVRTLNPGRVVAVDLRYQDPDLNGGTKTQCQGEKYGFGWTSDPKKLLRAESLVVVESPINALSVETAGLSRTAAFATRGVGNVENIDWHFAMGKRVLICMDNDEPNEKLGGYGPGQLAAWKLLERLTALNIAAHLVDQSEWEVNDVNDLLQAEDAAEIRLALQRLDFWCIPGVRGDDRQKGRARLWLPPHDYSQYWRFRVKEDFTTYVTKRTEDEQGNEQLEFGDLCGFRVAGISRVSVSSATATMTGDDDQQPQVLFAASVQAPRHGNTLIRQVFDDQLLHNVDGWRRFGPVFSPSAFSRMLSILERSAHLGERRAVNFVGLAWRDKKPVVVEGPDTYFTDPDKQCPYHNLTFPSGTQSDARAVIAAYQETFGKNAAAILLVWALGAHLKAFLGFWPNMVLQSGKGAGKSTLIKRLERTIAMTMFSGQSLQTEFRLLTSVSHTSHPVGWEEISARRQDIIDKAVGLLQESYQYTVTRRGEKMTEYLICAPVLLAGEDVPIKSLLGKVVRTDLAAKKGPLMPESMPRFPVRPWLEFLAGMTRTQVQTVFNRVEALAQRRCSASQDDDGARRMVRNYAAVLTAWRLLCEFADIDTAQGDFVPALLEEMNQHVLETNADREPWVWIIETILAEISAGTYRLPYKFAMVDGEHECLYLRPANIIHHLKHTMALRDTWNALPVKTDRVLRKQLIEAGVVERERVDPVIAGKREPHLIALSLDKLAEFGLYASRPEEMEAEVVDGNA